MLCFVAHTGQTDCPERRYGSSSLTCRFSVGGNTLKERWQKEGAAQSWWYFDEKFASDGRGRVVRTRRLCVQKYSQISCWWKIKMWTLQRHGRHLVDQVSHRKCLKLHVFNSLSVRARYMTAAEHSRFNHTSRNSYICVRVFLCVRSISNSYTCCCVVSKYGRIN